MYEYIKKKSETSIIIWTRTHKLKIFKKWFFTKLLFIFYGKKYLDERLRKLHDTHVKQRNKYKKQINNLIHEYHKQKIEYKNKNTIVLPDNININSEQEKLIYGED